MARRAARRAASGAVTVASDSLQGVCADAPVEALPPHDEQAQLGQLLSKGVWRHPAFAQPVRIQGRPLTQHGTGSRWTFW